MMHFICLKELLRSSIAYKPANEKLAKRIEALENNLTH